MQKQNIPALTSLRGIAAISVVLHHVASRDVAFIGKAYLWVDFFFILSGFVIALNYGEDFASRVRLPDYRRFMAARIARIYPLHLATLAVFVALEAAKIPVYARHPDWGVPAFTGAFGVDSLAANVALVHGWGWFDASWNGPAWSISGEFAAYLLFPYLFSATGGKASIAAAGALGMAASAAALEIPLSFTEGGGLLRALGGFLIGVQVFRIHCLGMVRIGAAGRVLVAAAPPVLLALRAPDILLIPAFAGLVLVAVCAGNDALSRALAGRPLVYLGDISYSIYLTHLLLFTITVRLTKLLSLPTEPFLIAVLPITILVSAATYRWLERPARSLVARWLMGEGVNVRPVPAHG